ncbi:MAG: FkbM family methyltransferase [Planctomycetes bacterium]|nr:FkbM family methyltransferase [Planctomycetota bacterium]
MTPPAERHRRGRLSRLPSCVLASYYRGPDHPFKIRIYRWLRRVLRGRLTVPYGGGWISLDEADLLQREILYRGRYEPEVWDAAATLLQPGDVVWDIGAHVGTFSVLAAADPRVAVIHAFEPDPETAEVLRLNASLNAPKINIHQFALGDEPGSGTLHEGPGANTGLSSLVAAGGRAARVVRCDTVDRLVFDVALPAPALVKIDVEGWEERVLRGARRLLAERPPRALLVEAPAEQRVDELERLLGATYRVIHLHRRSGLVESRENFLALRRRNEQSTP